MTNLYLSIALFALGAIVGMYLLSMVLQKRTTPKFVVFVHGVFVVVALVLLIAYSSSNPGFFEAIVLFVLAALGGVVLLIRDLSGKPLPKWLAVTHGLIAVTGFIFVLVNAFGGQ